MIKRSKAQKNSLSNLFWIPLFVESHIHDLNSRLWIPLSESCLLLQPRNGRRLEAWQTKPLSQIITSSHLENTIIFCDSALVFQDYVGSGWVNFLVLKWFLKNYWTHMHRDKSTHTYTCTHNRSYIAHDFPTNFLCLIIILTVSCYPLTSSFFLINNMARPPAVAG